MSNAILCAAVAIERRGGILARGEGAGAGDQGGESGHEIFGRLVIRTGFSGSSSKASVTVRVTDI